MSDPEQYLLKWKGRQSGPFSVAEIRSKIDERAVSLMHEVFCEGEWITLRVFLKRIEPAPAPAPAPATAVTGPPPLPQSPAAAAKHQELQGSDPGNFKLPPPDLALDGGSAGRRTADVRQILGSRETEPHGSGPVLRETEKNLAPSGVLGTGGGQPGPFFHAGFWMRGGAFLFDTAIVAAIVYGLHRVGLYELPALPRTRPEFTGFLSGAFAGNLLATASFLIILWLYFALFESSALMATPGKRITGLKVIQATGQSLNFAGASKRFAAKLLSGILLGWGFFLAAFTERKQALHDVLADSFVVGTLPGSQLVDPITSL